MKSKTRKKIKALEYQLKVARQTTDLMAFLLKTKWKRGKSKKVTGYEG